MYKNHTTALRALEMPPLVPYGTTFPPRWEACHLILSRLRLPANQVPLPPQAGALQGSAKPCTHKSLYFKHGLFCSRLRGRSGAAGKGEASAASQSAELFSCHMTQKSKSRNVLASPLGEEGHEVAKGVQANWIHRGEKRPANPVRRHPAKSVWTVVRMIMTLDVDVTAERRHYNTHRP